MGVRQSHFIIFGLRLPYIRGSEGAGPDDDDFDLEEAWLDKIEPYDAREDGSGEGRVVVLSDGMGGRYTLVGYCLAHAGEEGFGGPIDLTRPDMSDPEAIMEAARRRDLIEDALKDLGLWEDVCEKVQKGELAELRWMVLTHYR